MRPALLALGLMAAADAHAHQARAHDAGRMSFQPQVNGLSCLRPAARAMVSGIVSRIGPIEVTSTCGGRHARHSKHYQGLAVDFRPRAVSPSAAAAALRGMPGVGGIGTYASGIVHADAGALRIAWHGRGRAGARYRLASYAPRGR